MVRTMVTVLAWVRRPAAEETAVKTETASAARTSGCTQASLAVPKTFGQGGQSTVASVARWG